MTLDNERKWWKEAVVYQIWPSSFKDSNGSGSGDLNGITSKLPYLKDLGIDTIWLSPIYASPMVDMGYDISDYHAINPDMGTMQDIERLIKEAHKVGLKVVMDLVVNHTSDEHAWFQESKIKDSPKRDWYVWKKAKENGKEPNNWGAIFGGSCWEWDEPSQEYYLHVFDKKQPDLNWDNPKVREAVWDIMKFWLNKGCDGFRMDVINCISKEPGFPDVPITDDSQEYQYGLKYRFNGPNVQKYLAEMYDKVLQYYPDAFTVGETPGVAKPEQALPYVKDGRPLQMLFHFEHMYIDHQPGKSCFNKKEWKLTDIKNILGKFMLHMQKHNGWDSLYLENHDQPRIVSRWASDSQEHRVAAAKMLALFHATGRGTLFIYQGQEIGMANAKSWTFEELRDVEEINYYTVEEAKRPKDASMQDVLDEIQRIGRDNSRLPVSWDSSKNAGFTTAEKPWIKVNEDYEEWNVEAQLGKKGSVLEFWKNLIEYRKEESQDLVYGSLAMVDWDNEDVYAYTRTGKSSQHLIICSFSSREVTWKRPISNPGQLIMSNYDSDGQDSVPCLQLQPFECRLYKVML
jgi:glycosidase